MLSALIAGIVILPWPQNVVETKGVCPTNAEVRTVRDASLRPESYRLSVTPDAIRIVSSDEAGAFYARETLRQLRSPDGRSYSCCEIDDGPRFPWRGLLVDEARHFFGKEFVMSVIDRMSEHKLNVLHWHLVDDQGWRIEIRKHPELVRYGAVRPRSVRFGADAKYVPGQDPHFELNTEPYGPYFYTQDDIREILAYAKARHVRVVPEIEVPGHERALLAAHPELSCVGELLPRVPQCGYGVGKDVLCAGNDAVLKLLEDVFDEVCEIFVDSPVIHIGGDECPVTRWKSCPKCQARMKSMGFTKERQLHSWLVRHFTNYLERKGRRTVGWAEILGEDVSKSVIGMVWLSGGLGVVQAARTGADIVCTPGQFCYVDTEQELAEDPYHYNYDRGIDLKRAYWFDPLDGVDAENRSHVLGGQINCWSETTHGRFDFEWKTWPRGSAIAEVLWTGPEKRDWPSFRDRLEVHRSRLIARKVNCAPFNRWEVDVPKGNAAAASENLADRRRAFLAKMGAGGDKSKSGVKDFSVVESEGNALGGRACRKVVSARNVQDAEVFSFTAYVCTDPGPSPVFVSLRRKEDGAASRESLLANGFSIVELDVADGEPAVRTAGRARMVADWIAAEQGLDGAHVAIFGSGRAARAAILAAVEDERFALTGVTDAGVDIAEAYALVAPRLLLIASTFGREDSAAEFSAACEASSFWKGMGLLGLVAPGGFPAEGAPQLNGEIGFHLRPIRRTVTTYDWIPQYDWIARMDFAFRHGWRMASSR